jgi:putative transposase
MVCKIGGERVDLWCAVDDEGEVPDLVVQKSRDTRAALKSLKQLLHSQAVEPGRIVTDRLAAHGAALHAPGREGVRRPRRLGENNRAESSHPPVRRRGRKMRRFKSQASAQRFLTTHAAICNAFGLQRHIISQPTLRVFCAQAAPVWTRAAA